MHRKLWIFTVLACILLSACSAPRTPAPVVSLSTKVASQNNLTEISGDTYTVRPGDTLFAIAFYSGNTYRELAEFNTIKAPYSIQVGQTLRLRPRPVTRLKYENQSLNSQAVVNNTDSSPIVVDPTTTQAYGDSEGSIHRENQSVYAVSSNKPYSGKWIWPALGERKVATVGSDGTNRGVDIKGRLGNKILAAKDGKVVYAGNALKGYGNLIIIKHDDDYLSAYAHNERILVEEQSYVEQGQQIATMGQSGASEVMLHFEIRKRGKSRDPFLYLDAK